MYFKSFCVSKGILLTPAVTYTPQHNAVVERANRTLIEAVKCMMSHCDAYLPLWGEASMCAKYVINRTTKVSDPLHTSYEIWTGKKPNMKNMHVFGSDCYIYNHRAHREINFLHPVLMEYLLDMIMKLIMIIIIVCIICLHIK